MRVHTTIFLWVAACLGCASMVDEPYFTCHKDGDCPKGETCVELEYGDKICKSADCKRDSECDVGKYCDADSKQCREYCEDDWDCNMSEYCNEITNRCLDEDS